MTRREAVVAHAKTLLNTSPPSGVPAAVQTRGRVIRPQDAALPAISFYKGSERVLPIHKSAELARGAPLIPNPLSPVQRDLDLIVECVAAATDTTTDDEEVEKLTDWVEKALCGANWKPYALGAALIQTDFDYAQAQVDVCQASMLIRVTNTSKAGDSSAAY